VNTAGDAGSWTEYYRACLIHPGAVRRVERLLAESDTTVITAREAADALGGDGGTYDQVARVLAALSTAGVLRASPDGAFVIDSSGYSTSVTGRGLVPRPTNWESVNCS